MARAKQPPRVHRYSLEFKLSAVRLSKLPGVQRAWRAINAVLCVCSVARAAQRNR
jgi:transposase-like protein